jgi:2-iminoacetate synthase
MIKIIATTAQHLDIKKIIADRGLDGRGKEIWQQRLQEVTATDVEWALSCPPGYYVLDRLLILVSPAAEAYLEQIAQSAHQLTLQRFGQTIRLYAPLYLSNFCVNDCVYCGFNKGNNFPRIRLSIEQALDEADIIASEGFKDLLLVSSEDKDFIGVDYLVELASKLRRKFSSLSIEVYQMSTDEYEKLFVAGIEGVTLYQETYDRDTYRRYHPSGPKADYDHRLSAPDNIAQAGMREIGIGALLGLSDWRLETLALAEHAHYLMKRYWQSRVSFSFPRLRPARDVDRRQFCLLSDKNLVQMILALRLCFADAGLVISTREPATLRDHLIKMGITKMSAGSKTNPGGYTGHASSVGQFEIDDNRSPAQIAAMLRATGLEPVWKDWDAAFVEA